MVDTGSPDISEISRIKYSFIFPPFPIFPIFLLTSSILEEIGYVKKIIHVGRNHHVSSAGNTISCGLLGCAFMAGSVFAVTAAPPVIWLTVVFGIPGFALWGAAYFGYKWSKRCRAEKVAPLIDAKYDEACAVCGKAQQLL